MRLGAEAAQTEVEVPVSAGLQVMDPVVVVVLQARTEETLILRVFVKVGLVLIHH